MISVDAIWEQVQTWFLLAAAGGAGYAAASPLRMVATAMQTALLLASLILSEVAAHHTDPPKPAPVKNASPQRLRAYHIGNSVTDTIRPAALAKMAESRKRTYTWGRHMIPGAPLQWIWEHPGDGFKEDPFGYYPNALSRYEWDAIILQPFDRHLDGDDGDLARASAFLDLAARKSPRARLYIYSRWPRRDANGALDFAAKWNRAYTGGWDNTEEGRDYFEKLLAALRKARPHEAKRMFLVPVGDVLLALDKKMRNGEVPGLASAKDLYADGIHFGDTGAYVVGCTFYATLMRDDPRGLPTAPYGAVTPEAAKVIQETVWEVVRTHPLAGVAASKREAAQAKSNRLTP